MLNCQICLFHECIASDNAAAKSSCCVQDIISSQPDVKNKVVMKRKKQQIFSSVYVYYTIIEMFLHVLMGNIVSNRFHLALN